MSGTDTCRAPIRSRLRHVWHRSKGPSFRKQEHSMLNSCLQLKFPKRKQATWSRPASVATTADHAAAPARRFRAASAPDHSPVATLPPPPPRWMYIVRRSGGNQGPRSPSIHPTAAHNRQEATLPGSRSAALSTRQLSPPFLCLSTISSATMLRPSI